MAVGSFSAGLSGLAAHSTYLGVIGNNLANINTVGFKGSSVSFADLVSQNVGGTGYNPKQLGLGVVTGSISPIFSQGNVETSREATHAAIQGGGFFIVNSPEGSAYTRAGNFSFNADGELVTPDGMKVQGYTEVDPVTGQLVTTGTPTDILITPAVLRPPVATTDVRTNINLDANAPITGAVNFSTPVKIYDALGSPHIMTIDFERTGPGQWTYTASVPQEDIDGTPGQFVLGTGAMTFDGTGAMVVPNADVALVGPPAWANGALGNGIVWNITPPPANTPSVTSYAAASQTSALTQNGATAGSVSSVSIDTEGRIIATFGAGQTRAVAQLAMANFNNPKGLVKLGSNLFGEAEAAGIPNIGTAGTGGRGSIIGSAVEQSNVDIAQEFTQMILAQRGYQANSRTITVSDEILIETLSIKR